MSYIKLVETLLHKNDLDYYSVYDIRDNYDRKDHVNITLEYTLANTIKFEELDTLSNIFQTKKIDIEKINGYGGGCESCGYGADEGCIRIELMEVPVSVLGK